MSGKDARPSVGEGGGQLGRQWPGLGHVECNMCRVSEERPSKATGNVTQRDRRWEEQGSPLEETVSVRARPQAPPPPGRAGHSGVRTLTQPLYPSCHARSCFNEQW